MTTKKIEDKEKEENRLYEQNITSCHPKYLYYVYKLRALSPYNLFNALLSCTQIKRK